MNAHPNLRLLAHPLGEALLTRLRDEATRTAEFRAVLDRLSHLVAAETLRHLASEPQEVRTPLETTTGCRLAEGIVVVPILRAGLALMAGFEALLPGVAVGMLGLARNEETLQPELYLEKLPALNGEHVFILDPMLATGGSALFTIHHCRQAGAGRITLASILAAPEGLRLLQREAPEVVVVSAALDRELNSHGYILPGLGDAGDRYLGA